MVGPYPNLVEMHHDAYSPVPSKIELRGKCGVPVDKLRRWAREARSREGLRCAFNLHNCNLDFYRMDKDERPIIFGSINIVFDDAPGEDRFERMIRDIQWNRRKRQLKEMEIRRRKDDAKKSREEEEETRWEENRREMASFLEYRSEKSGMDHRWSKHNIVTNNPLA